MKKSMLFFMIALLNCSCMAQSKIQTRSLSGVVISTDPGTIEIAADHLPGDCVGHDFPESIIKIAADLKESLDPGRVVDVSITESDRICPVHGSADHIQRSQKNEVVKISPELAHELLSENPSIILIDVRLLSEYLQSHIPNSQRITYLEEDPDEFIRLAEMAVPDKDSILMVYCRTGRRSSAAAELLNKSGYTNVLDLGGIEEWNYEIEKGK